MPTTETPAKGTAAAALKAEAEEKKTVEFDGETYEVDLATMDDVNVLEMHEDGKIIGVIRHVVGPKQWATFKSKPRKSDELAKFAEAVFGVSQGES